MGRGALVHLVIKPGIIAVAAAARAVVLAN